MSPPKSTTTHYQGDDFALTAPFASQLTHASFGAEVFKAASRGAVVGFLGGMADVWYFGRGTGYVKQGVRFAGLFGASSAFLVGTAMAVAKVRHVDDSLNIPITGAIFGACLGLRAFSISRAILHAGVLGVGLYGLEYSHSWFNASNGKEDAGFFKFPRPDPWRKLKQEAAASAE